MARGKKKAEISGGGDRTDVNNASVEQLTKAVAKLSVKEKKKKSVDPQPQSKKLTPYQGKRQCFGLYECAKCNNEWASSHSWANTWQECLECRSKVYPHRQWPKKKRGKKEGDKPHRREQCGKCIRLGRYCGNRVQ